MAAVPVRATGGRVTAETRASLMPTRHRPPLEDEPGRRSARRPAPSRRLRPRDPPPVRRSDSGADRSGHRIERRPGEPALRGCVRRSRPRGAQDIAQWARRARRRAHRGASTHAIQPRRRLEGRRHGGPLRRQRQHTGWCGEPVHRIRTANRAAVERIDGESVLMIREALRAETRAAFERASAVLVSAGRVHDGQHLTCCRTRHESRSFRSRTAAMR